MKAVLAKAILSIVIMSITTFPAVCAERQWHGHESKIIVLRQDSSDSAFGEELGTQRTLITPPAESASPLITGQPRRTPSPHHSTESCLDNEATQHAACWVGKGCLFAAAIFLNCVIAEPGSMLELMSHCFCPAV